MKPEAAAAAPVAENPFIGLRRFEIFDNPLFFGRNEQSYELLRRLAELRFVAVIGPSGCGKSSLVRAGVLAALRDGYLAEGGPWKIVTLQPGNGPLAEWKRALTPLLRPGRTAESLVTAPAEALDSSSGRIVILIDQFEELFQYADRTGDTAEVKTFLNAMLATGDPAARVYLVLTMRSDYLVQCALYPELAQAINEGLYLVPRMTHDQLRQAIVGPVRKAGATITVALAERLLGDVAEEDDGLPVLQHALMRMWPNRNRFAPLGLDLYTAEGGLGAFLDRHAEQVYGSLTAEQKRVAEALFRTITERTREGRTVRRARQLDAIAIATGIPAAQLSEVARRFQEEGFLVPNIGSTPLVDIMHEAVARQWKRLGEGVWEVGEGGKHWVEGWMVSEARERRALARLKDAAEDWDRSKRNKSYLYSGERLTALETDLGKRKAEAGELEQSFLTASKRADTLKTLLSPRVLLTIVGVMSVLFIMVGLIFYQSRLAAHERELALIARAQAAQAGNDVRAAQTALVEKDIQRNPAPVTSARRIYAQSWNAEQDAQLRPVLAALKAEGYDVAASPERVSIGPAQNELRYFRQSEKATADRIVRDLASERLQATAVYVAGFDRKVQGSQFELWMGKPAAVPEAAVRPVVVVLYLSQGRSVEAEAIRNVIRSDSTYDAGTQSYKAVAWQFVHPTELHYFHKADEAEAGRLVEKLARRWDVKIRYMPVAQEIPSRYFEIWLQPRESKY
jgi:hypothetical protein